MTIKTESREDQEQILRNVYNNDSASKYGGDGTFVYGAVVTARIVEGGVELSSNAISDSELASWAR